MGKQYSEEVRKEIITGKETETKLNKLVKNKFIENKERYGVRRITASLHSKGKHINHKVVQRIMKKLELKGKTAKNVVYIVLTKGKFTFHL